MSYIQFLRQHIGHQTIIMPCACALIVNEKKELLLQKRVDDGCWSYHGGSIEVDESVEQALKREVKEELNIDIEQYQLFNIYSGQQFHHIYPNGDNVSPIDIVYLCTKYNGDIKLQVEEVSEIGWFNENNLPQNISKGVVPVINDYFRWVKNGNNK
ncbi:MAG: NUDIX domain-containing protein [Erysipelotrichaceae bacterium]